LWQAVVAVLVVLVLLLFWVPVKRFFVSAAVAVNVLVPEGGWRPLQWTTGVPRWRDIETSIADGRRMVVRVYEPAKGSSLGMVVYTPLIGGGLDDERLVNLAQTWARAGMWVAVPWSEDGLVIRSSDTEEVVEAAAQLQEQAGVTKLVLFGISYGNGPVFRAAVDDRLVDEVAAVISLNGMYDMANVVEFIESGQSHEYGREVMQATRAAGIDLGSVRDSLSPVGVVDQLEVPVYIIHSTSDQYILSSESAKLHEDLQAQGKESVLVLTDVIKHGTYRPSTVSNVLRYYIPAGAGFMEVIYGVLSADD